MGDLKEDAFSQRSDKSKLQANKKKKENKKKTYLYSKAVWLRILMPFTLKGLVQDEALQKVLMSENALNETSY